ncbi:hypothetical protein Oscil6304_3616 [Oscillatoria acuminata PCC 6304]|uniref:Uncharacterized protein n=1 Tax=Oscillatoria acuminata PCC 6304 TaxID=56110 RepID=K9TMD4_9CYAN|nr:hypothetical protein Oscil6304_3616 [Oscillatoria acuminata PCC 6304]
MTGHSFDFVLAYRFTGYGLQRVLARENKSSITDCQSYILRVEGESPQPGLGEAIAYFDKIP